MYIIPLGLQKLARDVLELSQVDHTFKSCASDKRIQDQDTIDRLHNKEIAAQLIRLSRLD